MSKKLAQLFETIQVGPQVNWWLALNSILHVSIKRIVIEFVVIQAIKSCAPVTRLCC